MIQSTSFTPCPSNLSKVHQYLDQSRFDVGLGSQVEELVMWERRRQLPGPLWVYDVTTRHHHQEFTTEGSTIKIRSHTIVFQFYFVGKGLVKFFHIWFFTNLDRYTSNILTYLLSLQFVMLKILQKKLRRVRISTKSIGRDSKVL